MESSKFYADRNNEIIKGQKERNNVFNKIDDMVELRYTLPDSLRKLKHMRTIRSTAPLAAILVGRRTLSTVEPQPFIQPLNDEQGTKELANETETILKWQLRQASRRAQKDIVGDIVESALRYDMIAVQTIPIDWQLKGSGKSNKKQYDNSKNYGQFMVRVENPKNVYPRYNALGLEVVVQAKIMRARDVIAFYGDAAQKLADFIKGKPEEYYVHFFEMWDDEVRFAYCSEPTVHQNPTADVTDVWCELVLKEHKLPFIPWTIEEGGTSLAGNEAHSFRGILSPIAHTDMYETQCLAKSLAFSEAIAYAAAPRGIVYSYADDSVRIDYGDINNLMYLNPGEDYKPLSPPKIDDNLLLVFNDTGAELDQLTGLKNLQALDLPSGTAFATINAHIKAATTALDPAKRLSERALDSIFTLMLWWAKYTKTPLKGFAGEDGIGGVLERKPQHIDPNRIFIETKLAAHLPTDRQQKINAATLLNNEMNFSKIDAYKELDVANPEAVIQRWEEEQLKEARLMQEIKLMNAQTDLQIKQMNMQLEMGMQQQVQQQQMQAQAQVQQELMAQEAQQPGPPPGQQAGGRARQGPMQQQMEPMSQATQGLGWDPSRGGQSPNEANPEGFLREFLTGQPKG